MSSNLRKVVGSFLVGTATVAGARAQDWDICINPDNTNPRQGYNVGQIANDLMFATVGFSGTTEYYGQNSVCIVAGGNNPAIQINHAGRIGFSVGSQGSVQSTFDDNMALTFGMPNSPGGAYSGACTTILTNGNRTKTMYGSNGLNVFFVGASHRYIITESTNDNIFIRCRVDVIGDATRIQWDLTNQDANPRAIGLWFGQWVAMFAGSADPATGATFSGGGPVNLVEKPAYITVPGQKPALISTRWIRSQDPSNFPAYIDFNFGQTSAYGLRVENGPTPSTTNPNTNQSDATQASEFVVGNVSMVESPGLLQAPNGGNGTFPDNIIPDTFINNTAYIQKFAEQNLAPNGSRRIVHYFRSTWGNANYVLPYTAVVDTPRLLATDDDGSGASESNGLFHNPFPLRVYVDNVGGYSDINSGFSLVDVKVKLTLPIGLNFVGEDPSVRSKQLTLAQVQPRQILSVDFQVEADGIEFGDLPYTVEVNPTAPTNTKKTIKGTLQVAATPRYRLFDVGAQPTTNAITTPFIFTDSSWPVVLGLNSPTDFLAYEWDPQLKGYVISTSAARGHGTFIINNTGTTLSNPLGGNPVTPPDTPPLPDDNSGRVTLILKQGWNLIGNPYNYPITIGQITGVSGANPQQSRTWANLVSQGIVNSSLAYWVPQTQSYKFLQKATDKLLPNTAYWIFVNTAADLTMSFPPVFEPNLPGSSRAPENEWSQTDKQWRLNLVVRNEHSIDDQNYIGRAANADQANTLKIMEPPMAPTQQLAASVEGQVGGQTTQLAQSLTDKAGRQEFKVLVQSKKDGEVTVTWPNMSTVPKNVRFRLLDVAAQTSRDMRSNSSYTFTATANSTREFKVQVENGTGTQTTIGNMVATRAPGGRGPGGQNAPFVINYTLSAPATTTVRILGSNGKEVFTVSRGRADNSGENSVSWNLKDNANRSVAPGRYTVELIATTPEGENVRRVVPINVIRG